MEKRINVTRPSMPDLEEYVREISPLWESRWLSNRGEVSKKFEALLKDFLGVEQVYCFANGHLALEIAIDGLFLPEGSEVITTPYTFCSTTHAIVRNGLVPVFVDVEPKTFTIDPEKIEEAITEKTVAIVATHVYGFACDVERIEAIAKKHNLNVIYDAAHAFGVTYKGKGIGTYGDLSMFSTNATKVFNTVEGGLITYKDVDKERFRPIRKLVHFGITTSEDVDYVGTNGRMNEFAAAMGICNLRHIDETIAKRKMLGDRYWERLDHVKGIYCPKPNENMIWNYAYMPVIFDGYRFNRNEVQNLLARRNVFARKYFYPLMNEAKCYSDKYGKANVPVAKKASETVLSLPMYEELTIEEVDWICDLILKEE